MASHLDRSSATSALLLGASFSFHAFWIMNVCKEAFALFKDWLNFYPPVGPLLGLFLLSILALVLFGGLSYVMLKRGEDKEALEREVFWVFVVSTILFFFLVFPPVYEPLVHLLSRS